ncbi:MAG TPA: protein kinase [Gemmataceae bacterium]|nr:protein kinase [Gemmataceae bacterium]
MPGNLRGLAAAHEQGLIHRDIKPANLWLTPEQGGRVKILDFGLARALADDAHITQSGVIVGTPAYMAPEQARGDAVDHRCDLFSLGVVLYRLTTGRLPFHGNSTLAVLTSLATDQPEPPRVLVGGLPAELSDLIVQPLAKDPAQRPATARAVADRLQAIDKLLATPHVEPERTEQLTPATAAPGPERREPAQATQSLPPAPLSRKAGRKPPLAIAAALGALALLVAGAVFFLQTPNGTIRIEINDDTIEAVLTKTGAVIKGADKAKDITVAAGEHGLKIKRGDLEFETDKFVLRRGDTIRLKIELLAGKVQVVQDGKVIGEHALPILAARKDRTAAVWVLSLGGKVTIDDGIERTVSAATDLPAGPWTLRRIDLNNNKRVSDDGLKHLSGLSALRELDLTGTQVTAAGAAALAKALPACKIVRGGATNGPAKTPGDADRRAAEWTLSVGGSIAIAPWQPIRDAKDLPVGQFRVVNVDVRSQPKADDAGLIHLKDLAELRSLCLLGTRITDAGLMHLKDLPKLESLSLHSTRITDAGLATIKGLPNLKFLDLAYTQVTDAAFVHFKAMASLEVLAVNSTRISETGLVRLLRALPKLRDLRINMPLNDRVMAHLKALPKLRSLGLIYQPNDDFLTHLEALPQLTELDLTFSQVSDAGLARLRVLPNLVSLDLRGTPVSDAGVQHLHDLKAWSKLQTLGLMSTRISDACLVHLQRMPDLWDIQLDDTRVSDAVVHRLLGLPKLVSIYIQKTRVSANGYAALKAAFPKGAIQWSEPNRTAAEAVLALGGNVAIRAKGKKDDRLVKAAAELPGEYFQLTRANLGGVQKSLDKLLPDLAALTDAEFDRVESLDLTGTAVTDADLAKLEGLAALTKLSLAGTKVSDAGLVRLKPLTALRRLDLAGTAVTGADLSPLEGLTALTELSLARTKVSDTALVHLKPLTALRRLDLDGAAIHGFGVRSLQDLPKLTELHLGCPTLTDLFMPRLGELKQLERLSLANSRVSDDGLKHLSGLSALRELDLTRTQVTAAGAAALAKTLPKCKVIRGGIPDTGQ